jgi:hypothetical protein
MDSTNPDQGLMKEDEVIIINTDSDGSGEVVVIDAEGIHEGHVISDGHGGEIVVVDTQGETAPEIIIVEQPGSAEGGLEGAGVPEIIIIDAGGADSGEHHEMPGMGTDGDHAFPDSGMGGLQDMHGSDAGQDVPGTIDTGHDAADSAVGQADAGHDVGDVDHDAADAAESQAHSDSAALAQQHADQDIQAGDYAAASHEREAAENEAWQGGDSSMLHGSDSTALSHAGDDLKEAQAHEAQEAHYAEAGDYRAARDEASAAEYSTSWADFRAGGPDHTGQAQAEHDKEDWAVWHQDHADSDMNSAAHYAAQGETDQAQAYASSAASEQDKADYDGHMGQHGADGAVHDPSSDVAHDTPVDDHTVVVDTDHDPGYDSGHDAGHDSGYDATHDSGHDSSYDTSHDSGATASHDTSSYDSGSHDSGTDA